jgi:SH3 domain protein
LRRCAACLLALLVAPAECSRVIAATAYVSDQLILGVYAQQNQGGERLATLHSGASVETLASNGDYTQVRTVDGVTGWVKSTFLVSREPAAARVKELEDELSRTRATTPALAEAAAHSEAQRLQQALAASEAQVAALRASIPPARGAPTRADAVAAITRGLWRYALGAVPALGLGFWWGWTSLARRIRKKFGGIKVY